MQTNKATPTPASKAPRQHRTTARPLGQNLQAARWRCFLPDDDEEDNEEEEGSDSDEEDEGGDEGEGS
eukprot:CAMPEP_0171934020 /NCGR_PEP_ID=MMETSP0993-20121228/31654_1 /TAXON_ID=483369 /ORGANISM="non described non described, Strain CCMP2098" /LENGTH=67 /DNA_ID=CAMNT_0012574631 /DNA_START=405 /DNA_END=608 /DNA_ORIENTATION=+